MTENDNEQWRPIDLPSSLETNPKAQEENERPAFPGELPPPKPPANSFPPGVEGPASRSGGTTLPAAAAGGEYPYGEMPAPSAGEKTYEDILNEARAAGNELPQEPTAVDLGKNQPAAIPGLETRNSEQQNYPQNPYGNANVPTYVAPQANNFPPYPGNNSGGQANGVPPTTNVMAIVALVLSFVCMGLIAIPLAIAALFSIKKTGQKGKGLAIAAIVVSVLEIVVSIVGVIAMVSFYNELVDQCESGNPDQAYIEACKDYDASYGNSDTTDSDPYKLNPENSF